MTSGIERELRFVLRSEEHSELIRRISDHEEKYQFFGACKELTVMYDNPNPALSFYSKAVDGRLRLRTRSPVPSIFGVTSLTEGSVLTWKQRLPSHQTDAIRVEKETEVDLAGTEAGRMRSILEDVLGCPRVSSYERTRETILLGSVEIAIDEFPYGHVIELEAKGPDAPLAKVADDLRLSEDWVSLLSCDDMYRSLCRDAGQEAKSDIWFDDADMPRIDEVIVRAQR